MMKIVLMMMMIVMINYDGDYYDGHDGDDD